MVRDLAEVVGEVDALEVHQEIIRLMKLTKESAVMSAP